MFKIEILPKNTKDKRTRRTKKNVHVLKKKKKDKIISTLKPTQRDLVYVQNWNSTKKIQKIKELNVPKRTSIYKRKKKDKIIQKKINKSKLI